MQNAIKEITMIRTFAALAALLTVGAVQAADMNMDMSGHEHHMMAGDHSMHMAAQSPAVQAVGVCLLYTSDAADE